VVCIEFPAVTQGLFGYVSLRKKFILTQRKKISPRNSERFRRRTVLFALRKMNSLKKSSRITRIFIRKNCMTTSIQSSTKIVINSLGNSHAKNTQSSEATSMALASNCDSTIQSSNRSRTKKQLSA